MSEGLRAEDVKEALERLKRKPPYSDDLMLAIAAARAWLASQEQTPDPDYEAAAWALHPGVEPAGWQLTEQDRRTARRVVEAALVGFHPQDDCDCEDGIVYTGHDGIPNMEPCPIHAAQPEGAER